jgi:hypothetical protein
MEDTHLTALLDDESDLLDFLPATYGTDRVEVIRRLGAIRLEIRQIRAARKARNHGLDPRRLPAYALTL